MKTLILLLIFTNALACNDTLDSVDEDDLTELDWSKCYPVYGGWKCRK